MTWVHIMETRPPPSGYRRVHHPLHRPVWCSLVQTAKIRVEFNEPFRSRIRTELLGGIEPEAEYTPIAVTGWLRTLSSR